MLPVCPKMLIGDHWRESLRTSSRVLAHLRHILERKIEEVRWHLRHDEHVNFIGRWSHTFSVVEVLVVTTDLLEFFKLQDSGSFTE